jgi:TolB-like protein/DNA-binding winged helix-turn-helix (wHTH) protein
MGASSGETADQNHPAATAGWEGRIDAPPLAPVELAREPTLRIGPLRLEPPLRRVSHEDGREDIVEPRVMQVLVALARVDGRILTRDDLLASCWRGVIVGEDAISRVMGRLRRLSEQLGEGVFMIETITKVGYRLVVLAEAAPKVAAPAPSDPASRGPLDRDRTKASPGPLLAVMPFDNLSTDPEMDFFSDGVAEEIQQTLSRSPGLRVIARSSSFQFRGADKLMRNIVGQLAVSHLLDGSVRRSGARVRIAAQLVDCATEVSLWSDRFDRELGDIFALQDEIAAAVARALQVVFSPAPATPDIDVATYETFLRAQSIITEGGRVFDDSGAAAAPLLEEVVRAAPGHARAWELLANARAWILRSGRRTVSYEDGRAAVVEAAETALRLDAARGGAFEALAMLQPWGAYVERESLLARALEAGPNEAGALTSMSTFCWSVGRVRDALAYAERACGLNPLFPAARLAVAQMQGYVGAHDVCLRMHEEILLKWPHNFPILSSILNFACSLGYWDYFDRAAAMVSAFTGEQAETLQAALRYGAVLRSEDPAPRLRALERLRAHVVRGEPVALNRLGQMCLYGFDTEALDIAEQASFDHMFDPDGPMPSFVFPGVLFGPWTSMNRDPRFVRLCARLGLCDYWTQTGRWPDCAAHLPYDFKAEVLRVVAG